MNLMSGSREHANERLPIIKPHLPRAFSTGSVRSTGLVGSGDSSVLGGGQGGGGGDQRSKNKRKE